jgi:hypothetical protein
MRGNVLLAFLTEGASSSRPLFAVKAEYANRKNVVRGEPILT